MRLLRQVLIGSGAAAILAITLCYSTPAAAEPLFRLPTIPPMSTLLHLHTPAPAPAHSASSVTGKTLKFENVPLHGSKELTSLGRSTTNTGIITIPCQAGFTSGPATVSGSDAGDFVITEQKNVAGFHHVGEQSSVTVKFTRSKPRDESATISTEGSTVDSRCKFEAYPTTLLAPLAQSSPSRAPSFPEQAQPEHEFHEVLDDGFYSDSLPGRIDAK